jgi:protoporphyrinogen/coproporphyrinogen III oxidase
MKSVAIIGGGITGLTAAYQLHRKGIPVTLYEGGARAGGVIHSVRQDGFLAEAGPNSILETSPKISALIRDLGLEPRRLYPDERAGKRYIVRRGKPAPMPASFRGFLSTPLFSARAKLRLLGEPFIRRAPPDREESLAQFVQRRIGREFLDYAINPFVAGVYAGDPARLSVQQAFPKLHALEQKYGSLILGQILGARQRKRRAEVSKQKARMLSFDAGLQVLTETLADRLAGAIRLNSRVLELKEGPDGWTVVTQSQAGEQAEEHLAVVYCGTTHQFKAIELSTARPLGCEALSRIYYPPVSSLTLGFRRQDVPHPLDGFGVLIPEVERFQILGTLFTSSLFPGRAPEGHVTLTSFIGGARAPELASRDRQDLIDLTRRDLGTILGLSGRPVFVHHAYYPRAIPQYEVGYGRLKTLMNEIEAKAPGLFLAGHYRDGVSLGDSIVSGHNVVERLESYLGRIPSARPGHSSGVHSTATA